MNENLNRLFEILDKAKSEIGKVILGQDDVIDKSLIAILTGQHVLLEGVPGIAKTLLVRTLSKILGCEFNRIQFTPDLMPADILGTNIFNLKDNEFSLVKGPIFTTFLLADEINRAPAKTQSALLQAMQERKVTIDRETHQLSSNFTVFATQNPIEYEGTYPLPEAQKDRFMMKVSMDYPDKNNELQLAKSMLNGKSPEEILESGEIKQVITEDEIKSIQELLLNITITDELLNYIVDLIRVTRKHHSILIGAGPRATQALVLGVRARAALSNRDFVIPDDVKVMITSILQHRIVVRPEYEIEGISVIEIIDEILKEIAVPR